MHILRDSISEYITLTRNNSLGHMSKTLAEYIEARTPEGLSDAELQAHVVDMIDEYFKNDEHNSQYNVVRTIGQLTADVYNKSNLKLTAEVTPVVEQLCSKIVDRASENYARRVGIYQLNDKKRLAPKNYTIFSVDEDVLRNIQGRLSGLLNKYSINIGSEFHLTNLWSTATKVLQKEYAHHGPMTMKYLVDQVEELFSEEERNDPMLNRILNFLSTNTTCAYNFKDLFLEGSSGVGMSMKFIQDVTAFKSALTKVYEKFVPSSMDILEETQELLDAKFSVLEDLHVLADTGLVLAKDQYSKTLVIGLDMLNGDMLEEYQKNGGKLTDISAHLRLYYNKDEEDVLYPYATHQEFPKTGLSYTFMLKSLPQTRSAIESLMDKVNLEDTELKTKSLVHALEFELRTYLENNLTQGNIPEDVPEMHAKDICYNKLTTHVNKFKYNPEMCIEDVVYSYVLDTWYNTSLVSTIHKTLGSQLVTSLSGKENLESSDIATLHCKTQAEIVSSFLLDTIVE
jgi:hypothetical protein